jgi:hypothetical protein
LWDLRVHPIESGVGVAGEWRAIFFFTAPSNSHQRQIRGLSNLAASSALGAAGSEAIWGKLDGCAAEPVDESSRMT